MKHLNPRQGITTDVGEGRASPRPMPVKCETPKSPPGDYNQSQLTDTCLGGQGCETPKSPPGDYNTNDLSPISSNSSTPGVKHLNPRQGITTPPDKLGATFRAPGSSRCETPKSPPGDYNQKVTIESARPSGVERVKHLNPRQGITTFFPLSSPFPVSSILSVKHLNPRQGITTRKRSASFSVVAGPGCETPKSPPGDYNRTG